MNQYALVFGLSADPVHNGHVRLVKAALDWLALHGPAPGRLLVLPTGKSNPAAGKSHAAVSFQHRYRQCQLAFGALSLTCPIQVLDTDWQRIKVGRGHNTSLDTLRALRATVLWRERTLMLLSTDHFSGDEPAFFRWHNWRGLLKQTDWLIAQRPGHHITAHTWRTLVTHTSPHGRKLLHLPWDAPAVASSDIRRWLASDDTETRKKAEPLLPEAVSAYIRRHRLYGVAADPWRSIQG